MRLSLISALLALAVLAGARGPATVQGRLTDYVLTVDVSVDGKKPAPFYVGFEFASTILNRKWIGGDSLQRHSLKLSGVDLGNAKVVVKDLWDDSGGKPAGILGMDVLSKFAVGIDVTNWKLTFWAGGKLNERERKAWIEHSEGAVGVRTTPLRRHDGGYELTAESPAGLHVRLASAKAFAFISKRDVLPFDVSELMIPANNGVPEVRLTSSVRIPGAVPWIGYMPEPGNAIDEPVPDAMVTIWEFASDRILFDFPGLELSTAQLTPEQGESAEISYLLRGDFTVRNGKLFYGRANAVAHPAGALGGEILDVNGVSPADLFQAMRDKSASSAKKILQITRKPGGKLVFHVMTATGIVVITLDI